MESKCHRYKLSATIIKPVYWVRYTHKKLTQTECEKMFSDSGVSRRYSGDKARIEKFFCEELI
ncbi:DUF1187 family protein (plasmid) [Escherichia albertii]|uniref:DUF1187 family protein n=1 Tax=Escherichia albertii TaxID=208962 RepID=UPI00195C005F|nr:DUF1187 family protein [Escherichia albertii]QST30884.1 DUF1187 family protein [Escherichia albertii]QST40197.1 DUF1187 family protein [Escherichia albertii]